MNLPMSKIENANKIFVSIFWGYQKDFYSFSAVENYQLHPLVVAKNMGYKPVAFVGMAENKVEDDPHYDPDIKVIYYKNIWQYLLFLWKHRSSLVYANTFVWQSFIVPFICRRSVFMGHHTVNRKTRLKQLIQDFVFKFFWRIRVVVEGEKQFLIRHGCPPEKIFVIPYALDTDNFHREENSNRQGIVYLGKITRKKNPGTILKAIALAKKHVPNIKLYVIGEILEDKQEFLEAIKNFDLGDNIELLGFVPHYELPRYLNRYLIYVNSSVKEGQCLAVYEAVLCGLNTCLPRILAFEDIFKDKALFHEVFDHETLAKNIVSYLQDSDLAERHNRDCREFIVARYGKDYIERQLIECFTV